MLSPVIKTQNLLKFSLVAAMAASLAFTAPAPAQAFGKNERHFVQGAAAALLLGAIVNDARRHQPAPRYVQPQPVYVQPQRTYVQPRRYYEEPRRYYQEPRRDYVQPQYYSQTPSIYRTPAAQAFNSYTPAQRRAIQQRLAAYGYYRSGIDGSFGPGTYNAIAAYARDSGNTQQLASTAGAFGVYDSLVY